MPLVVDPGAVAILAAVPAAIAGYAGGRRKVSAETESIAVSTLRGVIRELRVEIAAKEAELGKMRKRLDIAEAALEKITLGEAPPHLS